MIDIRDLTTLDGFQQVIELETRVWGYPDGAEVIPLPLLAAGVRRGAVVLGAFDGKVMAGATYSFPAIKDGRTIHWSHMLGVLDEYRDRGVGRLLKLAQRERVSAMGIDTIEWTFDPLQAANAHFNLVRLGVFVEEYEVNVYGESASPLWQNSDSDRFVAEWNLRTPHVERRLNRRGAIVRASDALSAVRVLEAACVAGRVEPGTPKLEEESPRLLAEIPADFAAIRRGDTALTRRWRDATRSVFTTYLPLGYRVVDFWFDTWRASGTYLLARSQGPRLP